MKGAGHALLECKRKHSRRRERERARERGRKREADDSEKKPGNAATIFSCPPKKTLSVSIKSNCRVHLLH